MQTMFEQENTLTVLKTVLKRLTASTTAVRASGQQQHGRGHGGEHMVSGRSLRGRVEDYEVFLDQVNEVIDYGKAQAERISSEIPVAVD